MNYEIRKVTKEDIIPALDLAYKVFKECDSKDYGVEHTERMRIAIEDRKESADRFFISNRLMFVAIDKNKVIGMIETYGNNRISLLFVDQSYKRQGIATNLMTRVINELKEEGYHDVVLNSSPNGLKFYTRYGFTVVEEEKNAETPWKTPLIYFFEENF